MIRLKPALALALALLFSHAPGARAHTLWLETPAAAPAAGAVLQLNVGFNEGFELAEVLAEAAPRIAAPKLLGAAGETAFQAQGQPNYLYASAKPVPAGDYLSVTEYEPFVMKHGAKPNKYFMTAKHVVKAGTAGADFITRPLNRAKLELVPLADPAGVKAGGSLPVQVLFDGRPLSRAAVLGDFRGFNPAGGLGLAKAFYCQTDKEGRVDFLPVKGGLWILKVRHAVPNEDKSEAEETVYLSNLTFRIGD